MPEVKTMLLWLVGTTTNGHRLAVRECDHREFRDGRVSRKDSYGTIAA